MKYFHLVLFSLFVFTSCSNDDNDTSFNINGQFIDNDIECSSISIEQNCIKFISFINNSEVYILYEGDIVLRGNYIINRNKINVDILSDYIGDLSFNIIDEKTLERIQDGAIFSKQNN